MHDHSTLLLTRKRIKIEYEDICAILDRQASSFKTNGSTRNKEPPRTRRHLLLAVENSRQSPNPDNRLNNVM